MARSPSDIDALSGLGDIARQRRQNARAISFYNRVLSQQPSHLPTVMASADMNWHAGRQQAAVNLYRRALGQVGTSHPYGARALRRIEEFEGSAKKNTAPAAAKAAPEPTSPAVPEPAEEPEGKAAPDSPGEPEPPSAPEAPDESSEVEAAPEPGKAPAAPEPGKAPSTASAAGNP